LTGSDLLELSQFGNAKIDLNNNEARISLETDSGALSLHVRVRQGVTDVSLDGQAAAQFGAHSRDLEAYLSKEGLTLGRFAISDQRLPTGELGDGDARGQNSSRQEPDENVGTENAETSSERPVSGKPPRVRTSGRVHVKA